VLGQLCGKFKKNLQAFSDDVNGFNIDFFSHLCRSGYSYFSDVIPFDKLI